MNWIKDKKQRIVIISSVAIILCSFPIIPLAQKADGFPHNIWNNLIILMLMVGGGGLGAVISLHIAAKRSKQKRTISQGSDTNRLKEKANKNFMCVSVGTIVSLLGVGFLTYANARGLFYLMSGLCPVCVMAALAVFGVFKEQNKHCTPLFDERESYLIQRAVLWGHTAFITFAGLAMVTAFYLVGGRGTVPMWSIPVGFFGSLFSAGLIEFLVLSYHAREDEKITEEGVA